LVRSLARPLPDVLNRAIQTVNLLAHLVALAVGQGPPEPG
jgi:hypothetical protein